MANLSTELRSLKISDLAIPGSHDSGSYSLLTNQPIDVLNEHDKYSRYFKMASSKSDSKLLNEMTYRWSKTQDLNITEQLKLGIRYFDFRLAEDQHNVFRVVHRLFGVTFEEIINQINDFSELHPKEVLLVDIRQIDTHPGTSLAHAQNRTISQLQRILKSRICPNSIMKNLNVRYIWKQNCQILIFYNALQKSKQTSSNIICSNEMISSPFNEKMFQQKSQWMKFLDKNYIQKRTENQLYVTQGIMQPHWMEIAVAGDSERATLKNWVSDEASLAIVKWLKRKHIGKNGINIVIADFVENHHFVDSVLSLNVASQGCTNKNKKYFIIITLVVIVLTTK